MDTITYRAVIDGSQIAYLQSVIESYDGIAAVRTMDGPAGIIELWTFNIHNILHCCSSGRIHGKRDL